MKVWIRDGRRLWIALTAMVLAGCAVGIFVTRDSMEHLPFLNGRGNGARGLVDQRPWQTVQALAPLAVSAEETGFAHQAERLADHEVDQAFAMALRQANAETPVLTGRALELSQKVVALEEVVKQDKAQVDSLTAQSKGPNGAEFADDLEIAKAQAGLENDELTDAQQELAQASGDKRSAIQQELAAREAGMKKYDSDASDGAETAVISSTRYGTLYGRVRAWLNQRSRYNLLLQAAQQAEGDAAALNAEHLRLTDVAQTTSRNDAGAVTSTSAAGQTVISPQMQAGPSKSQRLEKLKKMSAQQSILAILGDRIQTQQQLAAVYRRWIQQVEVQHRIVLHLMLQSFAWIAFILLCAALILAVVRTVMVRMKLERRSFSTLQTIFDLAIEFVALLLILLVIFGPPSQVPTILGLATAGLTVVFQDFILAFFGWFVLMGRNGFRVGDWVEINGVGGEVMEIGLFRTALLETGNWTDKGHPTGRRITFVNKFAMTGQYFNFSTAGQWMWDEITLNVPRSENSYKTIEAIHQAVIKETEKDSEQAEEEWQRATSQKAMSQFKASPSVDMRPASSGIDIVVRYVTRASDRFEVRNRLYQAVVRLLDAGQAGLSKSAAGGTSIHSNGVAGKIGVADMPR